MRGLFSLLNSLVTSLLLLAVFFAANTNTGRQGFDRYMLPLIRIFGWETYGFERGTPPDFGRGQRLQVGDWELRVAELRELGSLPGTTIGSQEVAIGGKWILAVVEGQRGERFSPFPPLELRDASGRTYTPKREASGLSALLNPEAAPPTDDANAPRARRFLAFEVDRDARDLQLVVP